MTGRCTRRRASAVVLLLALPGCVMGHVVDAGRRRETPVAVTAAGVDDDRLLIRYVATVTDDGGAPLGGPRPRPRSRWRSCGSGSRRPPTA